MILAFFFFFFLILAFFFFFLSTSHPDASYQVSSQLAQFRRRKTDFQKGSHSCHLGYLIGKFYLYLIYKSSRCFLPSLKSVGLLIQKKKCKTDFQDGGHGGHLGFPIRTILALFDLHVTKILPTKFQVNGPFGSGGAKNRFSRWWPSWISNLNSFSFFWSISHLDASTKFPVNWLFGSGKAKNGFSRWRLSWISDLKDFSYFWSTSHLMLPTKFQVNRPKDVEVGF